MRCPSCQSTSTRVVDSRLTEPGDTIRRRRECEECGGRFTTYERAEAPALAVIKRSAKARPLPDLFIFAVLGYFRGYYQGYSKDVADRLDYLTWTILKGHTNNRGGTVTLRSADPRDPPRHVLSQ